MQARPVQRMVHTSASLMCVCILAVPTMCTQATNVDRARGPRNAFPKAPITENRHAEHPVSSLLTSTCAHNMPPATVTFPLLLTIKPPTACVCSPGARQRFAELVLPLLSRRKDVEVRVSWQAVTAAAGKPGDSAEQLGTLCVWVLPAPAI